MAGVTKTAGGALTALLLIGAPHGMAAVPPASAPTVQAVIA